MPLILNIETATEICSICLSRGDEILALREAEQPNDHARNITLLIEDCTKAAGVNLRQLDAVAVSMGPGSYTSLRVGASVAKGICYSLKKPLIAVDTLATLAKASNMNILGGLYCALIDARRMETYGAIFEQSGKMVREATSEVMTEDSFRPFFDAGKTIVFSGNGSSKCKPLFFGKQAIYSEVVSSAGHLVSFANKSYVERSFANVAYFAPLYLKPPNITHPRRQNI